jgi:hypothetical protein
LSIPGIARNLRIFGLYIMQNEKEPITVAKFDELYISSPKRRLLDAKDQAAYFEREVCSCATEYDDSPVLICIFSALLSF